MTNENDGHVRLLEDDLKTRYREYWRLRHRLAEVSKELGALGLNLSARVEGTSRSLPYQADLDAGDDDRAA